MEKKGQIFELEVTIDDDLVEQTKRDNMKLCLVRSMRSKGSDYKIYPTIWVALDDYDNKNVFVWSQDGYQVFTSNSQVKEDTSIDIINSYPITFGQSLVIKDESGQGEIEPGMTSFKSNITIENNTSAIMTTGLLHTIKINGEHRPAASICAQTVEPQLSTVIVPTHNVFVVLAPNASPGTTITQFLGDGILVKTSCSNESPGADSDSFTRKIVFTQIKQANDGIERTIWQSTFFSEQNFITPIYKELNLFDYLTE